MYQQRLPARVMATHWICIECHKKHLIAHAGGMFPKGMACQGGCTAVQQAVAQGKNRLARELRTVLAKARAQQMKIPKLKIGDVVVGTRRRRR
jgi:hypothetical protein